MIADDDKIEGVPVGAIKFALSLVESLADHGDTPNLELQEVQTGIEQWGHETVIGALSVLVGITVELAQPPEDQGDALHLVVPAVIAKLDTMDLLGPSADIMPTVGGLLTAAALGYSAYQWRSQLGPIPVSETLAWCYVVWALCSLLDFEIEPGSTTRLLRATLQRLGEAPDALT